jgi:transposase
MLAHVITSKYCDHQPLNRLSNIFARHGLDIPRSTMCGWMGASAKLLQPLMDVMIEQVLSSDAIHTDDSASSQGWRVQWESRPIGAKARSPVA